MIVGHAWPAITRIFTALEVIADLKSFSQPELCEKGFPLHALA
jgi:hypothetical protein